MKTRITKQMPTTVFTAVVPMVAAALFSAPVPAQTTGTANSPVGQWWTPGFSSRVEITHCGQHLCGTIAWLWDPDSAKRGQTVLKGLSSKDGRQWVGGTAFDPSDGNTYKASMELLPNHRLKVSGCVLVFCQDQIWIRVGSLRRVPAHLPRIDEPTPLD